MKINEKIAGFGAPVGRFLISIIFFMSGIDKLTNYQNTVVWMESQGVPGHFLLFVIPLEILGSIAIIVGWNTRLIAFLFAGFCFLTALLFHGEFSDQLQLILFMKNLAIAGGFLILSVHGAGTYSLDGRSKLKE